MKKYVEQLQKYGGGFINLHKEKGLTSHDCVHRMRRVLNIRKIGHCGTLDPFATGVLPLAVGKATRLIQFLTGHKTYHATIRYGQATDTDDITGKILHDHPVPWLTKEKVEEILRRYEGRIMQKPPIYSAIHIKGERSHELARKNKVSLEDIPARERTVQQLKLLEWTSGNYPEAKIYMRCDTGTYVRSIARDSGTDIVIPKDEERENCVSFLKNQHGILAGGTTASIERTRSGAFTSSNWLTVDQVEQKLQDDTFELIQADHVLHHVPAVILDSAETLNAWSRELGISVAWELVQFSSMETLKSLHRGDAIRVYGLVDGEIVFLGVSQLVYGYQDVRNQGKYLLLGKRVVMYKNMFHTDTS